MDDEEQDGNSNNSKRKRGKAEDNLETPKKQPKTWYKRDEKISEAITKQGIQLDTLETKVKEAHTDLLAAIDKVATMSADGVDP
eukprot:8389695-Alexandrium_andersonii.AAC.1